MVQESIEYLKSLEKFGMRPGLERIGALLRLVSNPQNAYRSVHIAGTNGKGSTCAILYSILLASGVKAGLFSKPHMQTYRERIRAMGELISPDVLDELVTEVRRLSPVLEVSPGIGSPTEFESGVAIAFEYFRRAGVEMAVVETGMGGTWDATNVISPSVCAITSIALDHMDRLGSTVAEVADQKAGIMKPGVPVVVGQWSGRSPEVMDVLLGRARELECPVVDIADQYVWVRNEQTWEGQDFDLWGPDGLHYSRLYMPLLGEHQLNNAATAVACAHVLAGQGWPVDEYGIRQGLRMVAWPGRLEVVSKSPRVVLDGALNPQGAVALADALKQLAMVDSGGAGMHLVVGVSCDKDLEAMLRPLVDIADSITATRAQSSRLGTHDAGAVAEVARRLRPGLPVYQADLASEAVEQALGLARPNGIVCICGSLYLVGEVRGIWREAE